MKILKIIISAISLIAIVSFVIFGYSFGSQPFS